MHINNNVQKIAIENILNQIGEVYTKIGDEVILYPLRIVSGITNFTENGQFKVNYNIDKFTSDVGVINSNEPIVCYWEGAYKSYVPTDILGANYQLKHMSATDGKKISTWIMQYSTESMENEQMINDNSYTTLVLNRNIRSFSTDWIPNDNEMKYYLYLYLDKKAKSMQFLKMVSKEPRYLPGGKLAGCEMSFINLNQAYSQSGKDVLNFVKMTHPGGNYPFPKEITTEEGTVTILDYDRLNNRGVNDIQLQFWNSYWLNSIIVYGAPKSNWKITAPRRLLLCNPHPPISSSLDIDGSALNNYYAVFQAQTLYKQFWNTWKDKVQTYYDYTAQKKFMGGWQIKSGHWSDVEQTNPVASDTSTYNMWNNWTFRTPVNPNPQPESEQPYSNLNITFNTPETAFTDSSITFTGNVAYKPEDFLNHNSFIFSAMEALPMEFTETTRYTLGDFGILGRILQGFVQIFTAGFNPGWTTNNTWVPNKSVNFLIPTTTFDFGRAMTSSGEGKNDPIPFDCVNPEFTAGGNKTCVCGYRFQLTRYFQSASQAIATSEVEGEGKNGIWDTKYLGQDKWEDGTWIFDNHQPLKWKSDCKAISPIEQDEEYEVFLVSYKGIGLTTCRMTFYNYINHDPANVESVWESIQLTNAKFKNDLTLWTNTYKLNFSEEMNNEGLIDYPTNVIPPSPTPTGLNISEFEKDFNSDALQQGNIATRTLENNLPTGLSCVIETTREPVTAGLPPKDYYCMYKQDSHYLTPHIEYDLTKKIGVGKLNDYRNFTFRFIAKPSDNYQFTKDIAINISDLVDNQWTPIKIADLTEIISGSNKDAYPNNKSFSDQRGPKTFEYAHELLPFNSHIPMESSTPAYIWIKLNKTTQVMQLQMDGISDTDYPFTDVQIGGIGDDTERDMTIDVPHVIENTFEITGATTGGDYIYADIQSEYDMLQQTGELIFRANQKSIAIPKSILDGTAYQIMDFNWDFGGADRMNIKMSVVATDSTHIKVTETYTLLNSSRRIKIHNRINFFCNRYPKNAVRNYEVFHNDSNVTGGLYNDYATFFKGYKIENFYINPNT